MSCVTRTLSASARLVLPVGERDAQVLRRVTRRGPGDFVHEDDERVTFVPLIGRYGFAEER